MKTNLPSNTNGKEYWRSLDQLAQSTKFKEFLHREFPEGASEMGNDWSRRSFLTLMGASIALAGLAGCRRPVEKIVPYVERPDEVVPGNPMTFATTMPFGMNAFGLLARSHEGRPTKLDGNSLHPSTHGNSNTFIQAEILNLYDPDRSQTPRRDQVNVAWEDFVGSWRELYQKYSQNRGRGLAVLSESFSSPSLSRLKKDFMRQFPQATWTAWEPISDENIYDGVRLATGNAYHPVHRFENARVILSLDSDFLHHDGNTVTNARGFAKGRRVESRKDDMSRLWVVESAYTTTGGMADHRMKLRSSRVATFAVALARELSDRGLDVDRYEDVVIDDSDIDRKWLETLASDLQRAGGDALIVAGKNQPAWVHAVVFAINSALGAVGNTVVYHEMTDASAPNSGDFKKLVDAMSAGQVETLVMLGGNPAYTSPVDIPFGQMLGKVSNSIHFSSYVDETSQLCSWHVTRSHFLESWGDARSIDGTLSVIQPLIAPLFDSRSDVEMYSLLATGSTTSAYELVRETWRPVLGGGFEDKWRVVLHDGVLKDRATSAQKPRLRRGDVASAARTAKIPGLETETMEVTFRPSNVYDGRYGNNGWLQELPDTLSKVAWDNAALMSLTTAKKLGVNNEDVVQIDMGGYTIDVVAWKVPGHADDAVTLLLGYGRDEVGRVASGVGFDTYKLRTSSAMYIARGATVTGTGRTHEIANTQDHGSMEGRPIIRESTLAAFKASDDPIFKPEPPHHPPLEPLWDPFTYTTGYQWGMSIDLNSCVGCNACTIACQSENNIPIVGKKQVRNGREMHWMRVDRYFVNDSGDRASRDNPETAFQPMLCQHCEYAPCESVCPVGATMHDDEGLNVMVYNRCIGTRYCSNNCPYKVRRFNFFNYTSHFTEIHKMSQNPEVTVRSRGVMEKCTYCLQRINHAKIQAKREKRRVTDNDLQTACQQACPADAIVFGDTLNPDSAVSKQKKLSRTYAVLQDYMTKPRTTYLARLRNPHPDLVSKPASGEAEHSTH